MQSLKKISVLLSIGYLLAVRTGLNAQDIKVYPTNWWVGMKWNKVQLLVFSNDVNFNKFFGCLKAKNYVFIRKFQCIG